MSSKVTCPYCAITITSGRRYDYERHVARCTGQNNNLNHCIDYNNNFYNEDDMSITSSNSNDSTVSLINTLPSYSLEEYNTDLSSDTEVASTTTNNDDIFSTTTNQQSAEEMSCDSDNISIPSIDVLDLEEVIDYSLSKQLDSNCDSSVLLDPFEAKLLQLFVNNSIPITLFSEFTKLYKYGIDSK